MISAAEILLVLKKTQSKNWVFCVTKCFKQITEQYEYYILSAGYGLQNTVPCRKDEPTNTCIIYAS
jgi:hypothetical protein